MAVSAFTNEGLGVPHLEGLLQDQLPLRLYVLIETCRESTSIRAINIELVNSVNCTLSKFTFLLTFQHAEVHGIVGFLGHAEHDLQTIFNLSFTLLTTRQQLLHTCLSG